MKTEFEFSDRAGSTAYLVTQRGVLLGRVDKIPRSRANWRLQVGEKKRRLWGVTAEEAKRRLLVALGMDHA